MSECGADRSVSALAPPSERRSPSSRLLGAEPRCPKTPPAQVAPPGVLRALARLPAEAAPTGQRPGAPRRQALREDRAPLPRRPRQKDTERRSGARRASELQLFCPVAGFAGRGRAETTTAGCSSCAELTALAQARGNDHGGWATETGEAVPGSALARPSALPRGLGCQRARWCRRRLASAGAAAVPEGASLVSRAPCGTGPVAWTRRAGHRGWRRSGWPSRALAAAAVQAVNWRSLGGGSNRIAARCAGRCWRARPSAAGRALSE